MLTESGAKLVVLVLNALHGLILFYQKDYAQLNVDGLFGLRLMEGQAQHIWKRLESSSYHDVPAEVIEDLKNLSFEAGKLANRALPHVFNYDPVYFRQFKYIVHKPYDISKSHRLTDPKLLWQGDVAKLARYFTEDESDKCIGELLESAANREENRIIQHPIAPHRNREEKGPEKNFPRRKRAPEDGLPPPGCSLSTGCLDLMLSNKGTNEYKITHQILYTAIADLTYCSRDLNNYLVKIGGYKGGLDDFRLEYCSNLLNQIQQLARNTGRDLDGVQRDLFLEMIFACGQFGYLEFVQTDWLEWVLNWQAKSGCYGISEIEEDYPILEDKNRNRSISVIKTGAGVRKRYSKRKQHSDTSAFGTRKLLVEKPLSDGCLSHVSAVAVGALTIFLRFLLDPGPKEWSHLRLDLQKPTSTMDIPLANRFRKFDTSNWKLIKGRTDWMEELPQAQPPPSSVHDFTVYFVILFCCLFFYATWRLFCKRRRHFLYPFAYKKL